MVILLTVFILTLMIYFLLQIRKPENYPPGPPFLPIVGHLFTLKKLGRKFMFQHLVFNHLNEVFNTNVLGLKMGNELTIVVSSYQFTRQVLTEEVFEGRPDNFFLKLRSMGKRIGITSADGEEWNTHRQFVVKHLRNLGMGKETMSILIRNELANLMKILPDNDAPLKNLLATCVINIIWNLTTGSSFAVDDPRLEKLIGILGARSRAFDLSGGVMNALPWLRFIAPKRIGYDMICKLNRELHSLFMETINEHYKFHSDDNDEDLIDVYITEIKKGSPSFSDEQLIVVLLDLFIAGSQTTSTTLDFALMMLIIRPDLQDKLQKQMDEVFDENIPITYAQKRRAPYAEAILMEVMRFFLITPIIGPRRTLWNTVIDNYSIPQDTTVLINLQSVFHDKAYWKDPEVFRPERFLDANGELINHDYLFPFALGKRRCPGEVLARNCLFTFFTEIVRNFRITLHPESPTPSLIPQPGIVCSPQPYLAKFTPRNTVAVV
ncbi:probable cytochrome P450 305a1 [Coccinella septempunctata]|uniref:probable cytochrome P450 305a1 n=1 Tax=Coccinella septempunctata TaxID=41139 RepID=UPI001D08BAD3|nr:probable cytochrome P450 305a1 [Coccinella septempunctata]